MKKLLTLQSLIFLTLVFVYCESPTKPERDAPTDSEGINYQVPNTPVIVEPGQKVGFGEAYAVSWNESERAINYVIEESSDSLFVTAFPDTVNNTSKDFQHYVDVETSYYYRVKGIKGEYSSKWSGAVDINLLPLDAPSIDIDYETIISGNEYSITWAAVDSAQTYIIQESTNTSFNNVLEISEDTTSYKTSNNSDLPVTYYYRVKASHNDNTSIWSNVVELTVTPPLPVSPILEAPVVHWNTVTLNWDAVNYATSYTIEEADNRNFTQSVIYESDSAISKIIFFDVDIETSMYYRMKANGISGSSDWSDTVESRQTPFTLELSVTENEVYSEEDFTLSWNNVDGTLYMIEESTNNNFTNSTEYSVGNTLKSFNYLLENQQSFFYRVQALDGTTKSDWSNTVEIVITPPIPDSPLLSEPVVNGYNVTVSWTDVNYAMSYTLEASQDSSFNSVESFDLDTASYGFSYSIEDTTTYYYRVKAIGDSGSSSWSTISTVTVEPITHELTIAVNPAGSGSTNPSPGSYTHNENSVISISATPNEGYRFINWSG